MMTIPIAFAALKLLLHALAINHYGYFRDELYYIACSKHLAWGYVDHPPLSIALLALVRVTLGDSLWAIRLLPALAGAGTVFLVGLLVRELGGGRFAQALACLAAVIPPVWLAVDHFFSMNTFDTFFWTLAAFLLLRAIASGRPLTWISFGVVVGLGLLNKWSMAWFAGGAFLGLLLTPERRLLRTPWPWVAAVIAAAMFAPNMIWEQMHAWPTLEFMRNAAHEKMVHTGFLEFWKEQVLVMNPVNVLLWLPGLILLLRSPRARVVGIAYLASAGLLLASGSSRPNYLSVAYGPLLAAGAVAIARAGMMRASFAPRHWGLSPFWVLRLRSWDYLFSPWSNRSPTCGRCQAASRRRSIRPRATCRRCSRTCLAGRRWCSGWLACITSCRSRTVSAV